MDIPIDAHVECADGPGGRSTHVILDPHTRKVTHLVVEEKAWPHVARLVPLELVVRSDPHTIWLRCTRAELAALDNFVLEDVVPPGEDPDTFADSLGYPADRIFLWPYQSKIDVGPSPLVIEADRVPPGERDIQRGTRVVATNGTVGRVDEFLVDPTNGKITHLVLREGHLWGQKDVTIPVSEIDHIDDEAVYLKLDKLEIGALPSVPTRLR
jgi:sporulation protein YlmC with PRC-barrel domain